MPKLADTLNYQSQLQQPVDKLLKRVAVIKEHLDWSQSTLESTALREHSFSFKMDA